MELRLLKKTLYFRDEKYRAARADKVIKIELQDFDFERRRYRDEVRFLCEVSVLLYYIFKYIFHCHAI